ncbi:MAG: hypothetical protein AB7O62_08005 [Pirellulales bacterium]
MDRGQAALSPFVAKQHESRTYSQNGEDGVLDRLFEVLGTTNRFCVEFGVGPGARQCNTRRLREQDGWTGLLMDCAVEPNHPFIRQENITAESINEVFARHQVPDEFDLLSIDIDGNDYWVWKALDARYRPRVLVMEYNASVPPTQSRTIEYDPSFSWGGTDYFGASLLALARLSRRKGYTLAYCESRGINAFFVRSDICPFPEESVEELYRAPDYAGGKLLGRLFWPAGRGHKKDPDRKLIEVEQ